MLRSFIDRDASPLLWASTYQAGEHVGERSAKPGGAVRPWSRLCWPHGA